MVSIAHNDKQKMIKINLISHIDFIVGHLRQSGIKD